MGQHNTHQMQETSLDSWEEIQDKLGERQMVVLKAIDDLNQVMEGTTDWEITSHLGYFERNKISPRRKELVNLRYVGSFGKKKCGVTGRIVIAWKLTKKGEGINDKINKRA